MKQKLLLPFLVIISLLVVSSVKADETKNEDDPHVSGAPGSFSLFVENQAANVLCGAGDYCPPAVDSRGRVAIGDVSAGANGIGKVEDTAAATADVGVGVLMKRLDVLGTGQVDANNDYALPLVDTLSRMYVNPWGAAVTEFVQGCNTAITTITTGDMIAADADERYYITSWSCTNTGGAATRVILEDDDGTDFANVMLAATTGFASVTFPTPVRAGAVNKGMQINVLTTGTSTICCANGFKSFY